MQCDVRGSMILLEMHCRNRKQHGRLVFSFYDRVCKLLCMTGVSVARSQLRLCTRPADVVGKGPKFMYVHTVVARVCLNRHKYKLLADL